MIIPYIFIVIIVATICFTVEAAIQHYQDNHPRFKAFLLYRNDYQPVALKVYGKSWITVKSITINEQAKDFDGYSDIEIKKKVIDHAKSIKGLKRRTMLHYNTTMGNVVVTLY